MRQLITIFFYLFTSLSIMAQTSSGESDNNSFSKAKAAYDIGNVSEAHSILSSGMKTYSGQLKLEALHLLSLCCLAEDEQDAAEQYARQLLKEDPFFRASLDDNPRFADLLQSLKSGTATVTSASQLAETLEEVPVPTTLITEEMIENSGCTNLQDLLCLYVPGMTKIDGEETNIAMHGVYGTYQEKILVMLNGHRLNSRTTNSETLDFRHSLAKIKQIEVLRGPASSLYGNVALTAVINIITKSGSEIDGAKISAGIGSFNTYKADFLMGKRYLDVDFTVWASIYSSKGQRLNLNPGDKYYYNNVPDQPGYMYVGGYNGKPSYDIGVTANWNNFSFLFNTQYSKKVLSYTPLLSYGLYDYDRYGKIQGIKPGNSRQSTHLELAYNKSWVNNFISFKAFVDYDDYSMYYICGDTILNSTNDSIFKLYLEFLGNVPAHSDVGVCQYQKLEDFVWGINLSGGLSYTLKDQKGDVLFGIHGERYTMHDNTIAYSDNFGHIYAYNPEASSEYMNYQHSVINKSESNFSCFSQIKQHLSQRTIINGGLRFDLKKQWNDRNIHSFSPRIAVISQITNSINVKASYAHSFVDASYFYRANTNPVYTGGGSLTPEKMDAWQLCGNIKLPKLNLNLETNLYYNKLTDLVSTQVDGTLANIGMLKIIGVELSSKYSDRHQDVSFNVTWQSFLESENNDYYYEHRMLNTPNFWINTTYVRKIFNSKQCGFLKIGCSLNFYGNSYTRNSMLPSQREKQSSYSLLSINAKYTYRPISLIFAVSNTYNTIYTTGSQLALPTPGRGASCLLTISYNIK